MTQVHGQPRDRLERPEIGALTHRLMWVRLSADLGREVTDALDLVRRQERLAQRSEVEPLVRRALEAAVLEVEPVNVDVGQHQVTNRSQPAS